MYKKFTLIELIVVIAIISILAAIVIPNISNVKEKANTTAIASNTRNLQTVVDMYQLDHINSLPGIEEPTVLLPQPIDFKKVHPDFLRNLPKTKEAKYWVDVTGTVWGAELDMPKGFSSDTTTGKISWQSVTDAQGYQVYEIKGYSPTSSLDNTIKYIPIQKLDGETNTSISLPPNKAYAVSTITKSGFLTAPIGIGNYDGYTDTLESGKNGESGNQQNPGGSQQENIAKITMTPSEGIDVKTTITWSYSESKFADNSAITAAEWQLDSQPTTDTPPTKITAIGNHIMKLRVQNEKGVWSDWTSKSFTVNSAIALDTSKTYNYVQYSYATSHVIEDKQGNIVTASGNIVAKHDSKMLPIKYVTLGTGTEVININQIQLDKDGNYVVAGTYQPNTSSNTKTYMAKLDSNLNVIQSTMLATSTASSDQILDFIITPQGNYIVAGSSGNDLTQYNGGLANANNYNRNLLILYDSNFNVIKVNNSSQNTLRSITIDENNNVYAIGGAFYGGTYIFKLDTNLNVIKQYDGSSSITWMDMTVDRVTGNIIAVGRGSGINPVANYIQIFDSNLNSINLITKPAEKPSEYSTTSWSYNLNQITQDKDNNFIVSGTRLYANGQNYDAPKTTSPFIFKYDSSFDTILENVYNSQTLGRGTTGTDVTAIVFTKDGGIVYGSNGHMGKIGGEPVTSNYYITKTLSVSAANYATPYPVKLVSTLPTNTKIYVYAETNIESKAWTVTSSPYTNYLYGNYSSGAVRNVTYYFYLQPNANGEMPSLDDIQ